MKPILFNTEMVRALLDGRKSVTRRVVKPRYIDSVFEMCQGQLCEASPYIPPRKNGDGTTTHTVRRYEPCKQPYHPGDILYVRETWNGIRFGNGTTVPFHTEYWYRADDTSQNPDNKWRPSIHMPKEAARLFLRVTDVRVERLQEPFFLSGTTVALDCQAEGIDIGDQCRECMETYGNPPCISEWDGDDESDGECGILDEIRGDFSDLWDSTIKKTDLPLYGWAANPWVWVIEFERITKEEAMKEATKK